MTVAYVTNVGNQAYTGDDRVVWRDWYTYTMGVPWVTTRRVWDDTVAVLSDEKFESRFGGVSACL